jgi:hypothetical protein
VYDADGNEYLDQQVFELDIMTSYWIFERDAKRILSFEHILSKIRDIEKIVLLIHEEISHPCLDFDHVMKYDSPGLDKVDDACICMRSTFRLYASELDLLPNSD